MIMIMRIVRMKMMKMMIIMQWQNKRIYEKPMHLHNEFIARHVIWGPLLSLTEDLLKGEHRRHGPTMLTDLKNQ